MAELGIMDHDRIEAGPPPTRQSGQKQDCQGRKMSARIYTVATLIDALQKYDPDMPVKMSDNDTQWLIGLISLEPHTRNDKPLLLIRPATTAKQ